MAKPWVSFRFGLLLFPSKVHPQAIKIPLRTLGWLGHVSFSFCFLGSLWERVRPLGCLFGLSGEAGLGASGLAFGFGAFGSLFLFLAFGLLASGVLPFYTFLGFSPSGMDFPPFRGLKKIKKIANLI